MHVGALPRCQRHSSLFAEPENGFEYGVNSCLTLCLYSVTVTTTQVNILPTLLTFSLLLPSRQASKQEAKN